MKKSIVSLAHVIERHLGLLIISSIKIHEHLFWTWSLCLLWNSIICTCKYVRGTNILGNTDICSSPGDESSQKITQHYKYSYNTLNQLTTRTLKLVREISERLRPRPDTESTNSVYVWIWVQERKKGGRKMVEECKKIGGYSKNTQPNTKHWQIRQVLNQAALLEFSGKGQERRSRCLLI